MLVSIIIPTYNRAVYLETAISSALAQDYENIEVVISDNASTDNTDQVAKAFSYDSRLKYFRNVENIGMVRNWHKAISEYASGDWFLILSDDDILYSKKFISDAIKLVQENPSVNVVYSHSYVYDETLNLVKKLKVPFHRIESGLNVFSSRGTVKPQDFALCNVLFPRQKAIELGAFSNPNNLSCDSELFLRLCLRGNVGIVQDYCSIYRVHSGNLLKAVSSNLDLIRGSLDSLLLPLIEANHMQIDQNILNKFVSNSRLGFEIYVCLIKIALIDPKAAQLFYIKLHEHLSAEKVDDSSTFLPSQTTLGFIFHIVNIVAPIMRARRKIIYYYNASKRLIFAHPVYFEPLRKSVYVIE